MTFGGSATSRRTDLAKLFGVVAEAVGLLNKGSTKSPAAPAPGQTGEVEPISSNSLNVTRVGGIAGLITAAGAAAIGIFAVKATDPAAVRAAAYGAVGLIVAAALITAAIIIAADIRARASIAVATSATPRAPSVKAISGSGATDVTLDSPYAHVLVDADEGDVVVTLPDAARNEWQSLAVDRTDLAAGRTVIVKPVAGVAEDRLDLPPSSTVTLYAKKGSWVRL